MGKRERISVCREAMSDWSEKIPVKVVFSSNKPRFGLSKVEHQYGRWNWLLCVAKQMGYVSAYALFVCLEIFKIVTFVFYIFFSRECLAYVSSCQSQYFR